MRLAISNLAWPHKADSEVAAVLRACGARGVEIAPTKIWPAPLEVSDREIQAYRRFWESEGLQIVALQALLFGRPELTIFDDGATREKTLAYLAGICRLATLLGGRTLVFGSPKNRHSGGRPRTETWPVALDFFGRVGDAARQLGVIVCIEPNPPAYGCDFVTASAEGAELVRAVASPGFGLHLDLGGMTLSNEETATVLQMHGDIVRHFHISEPHLQSLGTGQANHAAAGRALAASNYAGWISIEMKEEGESPLLAVQRALRLARRCYGGAPSKAA